MPKDIVSRIHQLAHSHPKGLEFCDRNSNVMVDNYDNKEDRELSTDDDDANSVDTSSTSFSSNDSEDPDNDNDGPVKTNPATPDNTETDHDKVSGQLTGVDANNVQNNETEPTKPSKTTGLARVPEND